MSLTNKLFSSFFLCIVISCLCTGCFEDPLQSLSDDSVSSQYSESYWNKQSKDNTTLWKKAVVLCKQPDYQNKPNCGGVRDIEMLSHPTDFPRYGSGAGFGQVHLSAPTKQ